MKKLKIDKFTVSKLQHSTHIKGGNLVFQDYPKSTTNIVETVCVKFTVTNNTTNELKEDLPLPE